MGLASRAVDGVGWEGWYLCFAGMSVPESRLLKVTVEARGCVLVRWGVFGR